MKALETEIVQLKEVLTSLKIQNDGSKYIPPQKRADWVQPTLLPKKKQVTFLEPHITSLRSTQKPPVQHKKLIVPVNMFPKAKPATKARKPIPKRNTQNHNPLPAKSVKARRAADYYRNLYVDISQFVDRSTKSVHTKPHQAKHVVNTSTNSWNATKNTVPRIVHIWKPTGRQFNLHDIFGSRTSTEPIVKPSELTPCISPSTNATLSLEPILEPVELSPSVSSCASSTITMVSRFSDYRLSDRKAGSNGISSIFTDEILVQTSPRSTQKPPVQHKKPTVPVNMFPKAKPATEARKPIPKRNTQNHNPLPAKSVKARRAADYYRNLNLYVDISQFVDRSTKSVHTKPHQAKQPIVKPSKLTPCISPSTNATLSLEPILEPEELSPIVSSCASSTITMVSR
nr:hypothetical protein [Tanacetum cinerariifolium]